MPRRTPSRAVMRGSARNGAERTSCRSCGVALRSAALLGRREPRKIASEMIELGLKFTLAYLLGAVLGSLVVGYLKGGVDIRKAGSGNAGSTNALRTQGKWFALGVLVIDVGKGIIAAAWLPGLDIPGVGIDPAVSRER